MTQFSPSSSSPHSSPAASGSSPSRYLTRRRLAAVAASLTPRHETILETLSTVRLATGSQLVRLHLVDLTPRRARAVLARLVEAQVLLRLPRRVGGVRAGSAGFVYGIGPGGAQLLAREGGRRGQGLHVGLLFADHTLAVSEVYVALREAERAGRLKVVRYAGEPATWRSFAGPGGGQVWLKPDATVTVQLGSYLDDYYLEIDQGTESTTTLARACDRYRQYWQTGREQERVGVFPRVLWLVPDERRYAQVVDVLGRQPEAAWKLFSIALQKDAVSRIARGVTS